MNTTQSIITKGAKESAKKARQHIIESITWDGYEVETEPKTDEEKLIFLHKTFLAEYGWAVDRFGLSIAIKEWLQGLPTVCTIAFYNHEILELGKEWGSLPENATEKQEDKILDNYWNYMSNQIRVMWNRLNITFGHLEEM